MVRQRNHPAAWCFLAGVPRIVVADWELSTCSSNPQSADVVIVLGTGPRCPRRDNRTLQRPCLACAWTTSRASDRCPKKSPRRPSRFRKELSIDARHESAAREDWSRSSSSVGRPLKSQIGSHWLGRFLSTRRMPDGATTRQVVLPHSLARTIERTSVLPLERSSSPAALRPHK